MRGLVVAGDGRPCERTVSPDLPWVRTHDARARKRPAPAEKKIAHWKEGAPRMQRNLWVMTGLVPCVLVAVAAATDPRALALPLGQRVGHPVQWLSHMVAHASVGHLLTNLVSALFVYICEVLNGSLRTAGIALAAGLTAALWMRALVREPSLYLGFSGCAYGIVGAVLACVWINLDSLRRPRVWLAATGAYVVLEVSLAQALDTIDGRTVAHAAHLAGATQGVACGLMFGTNVAVRTCERILRTLAAVASVAAFLAPVALLQSHAHQLR